MTEQELTRLLPRLLAEACGTPDALAPGLDLLESGVLDSLGLILLLDALADHGIEIAPTQVDRDRFRTMEGIAALCRERLATQGSEGEA